MVSYYFGTCLIYRERTEKKTEEIHEYDQLLFGTCLISREVPFHFAKYLEVHIASYLFWHLQYGTQLKKSVRMNTS
jgi:hypothetical protein